MVINKNSWHYKVWKFSYFLTHTEVPDRTNLCQYFMRSFLYVPLSLFCLSLILLVGGTILVVFPNIITILLGFGILIPILDPIKSKNIYRLYPFYKFPIIGRMIPPWPIVCFIWFSITLSILISLSPLYMSYVLIITVMTLLVFSAIVRLIIATDWSLVKEYLKAKKQKVCPIITFQ